MYVYGYTNIVLRANSLQAHADASSDFLLRLQDLLAGQEVQAADLVLDAVFVPHAPCTAVRHAVDGGPVFERGETMWCHFFS